MDRLIAPNTVTASQADTAPATGTPAWATDGNPATNIPATRWPAYQYNAIQEELIGTIVAAGITPDRTNNAQLLRAIPALWQRMTALTDTGTANAYVAANPVPLTVATLVHGVRQRVTIAHSNSGTATYAPDGLPPAPIVGMNLQPLQGLELIATQIAELEYVVAAALNGGNGAWLLLGCGGGALQVPAGSQSNHAVNLGQFGASLTGTGYQKLPGGLIVQWGTAGSNSSGIATLILPVTFPTARLISMAQYVYAGTAVSTTSPTANISSSSTTSTLYAVANSTAGAIVSGTVFFYTIGY